MVDHDKPASQNDKTPQSSANSATTHSSAYSNAISNDNSIHSNESTIPALSDYQQHVLSSLGISLWQLKQPELVVEPLAEKVKSQHHQADVKQAVEPKPEASIPVTPSFDIVDVAKAFVVEQALMVSLGNRFWSDMCVALGIEEADLVVLDEQQLPSTDFACWFVSGEKQQAFAAQLAQNGQLTQNLGSANAHESPPLESLPIAVIPDIDKQHIAATKKQLWLQLQTYLSASST